MTKADQIRDFLYSVKWVTPTNLCYLFDGRYSERLRHRYSNKLDDMTRAKRNALKLIRNGERKRAWTLPKSTRKDLPTAIYEHDKCLRNVLAFYLYTRGYGWNEFLKLEEPADALLKLYTGNLYIEMDMGEEGPKKLTKKITDHYMDNGSYRVIFFMKHVVNPESEKYRLQLLFDISKEVLDNKAGRILGCCYTQFLKDGKIYNHKMQEVKI